MKVTKDKNKIHFTADTHFGHANVVKFDKSPFWSTEARSILRGIATIDDRDRGGEVYRRLRLKEKTQLQKDVEKQDEAIIENWNKRVAPDDTVFHLGDVAFMNDKFKLLKLLDRLNGDIILITGNHEKPALNPHVRQRFLSVEKYLEIRVGDQDICLFHYPIHEWNKCHRGSWSLWGHTHQPPDEFLKPFKAMNVGIMFNNYTPFSYAEVQQYMATCEIKTHH